MSYASLGININLRYCVDSALLPSQIYVPTNPRGAESLPPGIVVPESDFYLRRLWGDPSEVMAEMSKLAFD